MKPLLCTTKNVLARWNSFPISSNPKLGTSSHAASSAPLVQHGRLSLVSCCLPYSLPEQPHVSFRILFSLPFLTHFQTSSCHSVCLLWLLPWAQGRRREVNLRSGPWCGYCFSARGKWFPASPVCLRKWAFLTTATFQGRCPCAFQLDHPSWLLCPMDLPKGCILEPLSHTNPAKLTVPFGSSGDCSPKGNITNKSPSKNGGMLFCIFSYYFLPPTQGKYWINSVYWGAGEKIRGVLI